MRSSGIDTSRHPLIDGCPPDWASGWGQDKAGVYVEFTLGSAVSRLRWIPPGRLEMGSRADAPGGYDDEGPLHAVTIGSGFWLFDKAVTQNLWEAVMGGNPSRFKSPDRPVEQVSWDDAQAFMAMINERVPGLDSSLPSEAQWQYASRGAIYADDYKLLGERNAPALDAISWYGGNSGVGFELADGHDSSNWSEQQYPEARSGTHPAGLKQANGFGLYDMLGNVWEWCADNWHENYEGAPVDGSAWTDEAGAFRVVLGISWDDGARGVRSAFRGRFVPDDRLARLGFRCARVQS